MIDLSLSDEQAQIVEEAGTMLREQLPVARLRQGAHIAQDHDLLSEWGWFAVGLREESCGLGLGVEEEALLFFLGGQYLLSPSILATTLAAPAAPVAFRDAMLAGSVRAALAICVGDAIYCFDRDGAELVVLVETGGLSLWAAENFAGSAVSGLDETVALERGRFTASEPLAGEAGLRPTLLAAAMLAGIARATTDLAVAYAKTREQFGQPIGAFQAIKHRCADMEVRAFAAESQLLLAAAFIGAGTPDAEFQLLAAALTASEAACENGAAAIQIHGGMGFTADCEAHFFLKRARLLSQVACGGGDLAARLLACDISEGA